MTTPTQADTQHHEAQGGAAPAPVAPTPTPGTSSARGLTLSLAILPDHARVGETLSVEVMATSAVAIVDAPLHLVYDPARLRFLAATEGEYMKRDNGSTVFLANGQSRPGDLIIGIGRTDRTRGAAGQGVLCRVRFEVLASGTARLTIGPALAWAVDGASVPVTAQAGEIEIP